MRPGRCPGAALRSRQGHLGHRAQAARSRDRAGRSRARGVVSAATADADDEVGLPSPHQTTVLFGHAEAEQTLLDGYRSTRVPHAWLIGGPPGIGKATLAYRFARFVLAHPDPNAAEVQSAQTLELPPNHPVARHVAAQAQRDLLVLERQINEKTGKL